jgi:exosortase family protein XrtF
LKLKDSHLKSLLIKYKPVIHFILLFLGSYVVLSSCYAFYLNMSKGGNYYPDYLTHLVADQCAAILGSFENAVVEPHAAEPSMKLIVNDRFVARIIEGCNSVNILILFTAFVIAFAQKLKKTLLFLFAGAVLIYAVNILRIVLLAYALYHYPQYENILHSVVFPGIIYGMVFLLWMLWVRGLKESNSNDHE